MPAWSFFGQLKQENRISCVLVNLFFKSGVSLSSLESNKIVHSCVSLLLNFVGGGSLIAKYCCSVHSGLVSTEQIVLTDSKFSEPEYLVLMTKMGYS